MRLSIITINHNTHNSLQHTIESVATQIFKDFEWFVIDSGFHQRQQETSFPS